MFWTGSGEDLFIQVERYPAQSFKAGQETCLTQVPGEWLNWRTKTLTSSDTAVSLAGLGSERGWNRGSAARLMLSGREQRMILCFIIHRVVLSLWSFWLCFVFFFARWFSIEVRARFRQVGGTPASVCSTCAQGAPTYVLLLAYCIMCLRMLTRNCFSS